MLTQLNWNLAVLTGDNLCKGLLPMKYSHWFLETPLFTQEHWNADPLFSTPHNHLPSSFPSSTLVFFQKTTLPLHCMGPWLCYQSAILPWLRGRKEVRLTRPRICPKMEGWKIGPVISFQRQALKKKRSLLLETISRMFPESYPFQSLIL